MTIKVVFALGMDTKHNTIAFGYKNTLPWGNCKEDLKHFKAVTANSVLVMGSNTFKSLPGILPGRLHCVMSKSTQGLKTLDGKQPDQVIHGGSLSDAVGLMQQYYPDRDICIIGGKGLIVEALSYKLADEAIISHIRAFSDPFGVKTVFPRDVEFTVDEYSSMLNDYKFSRYSKIDTSNNKNVETILVDIWKKK